MPTDQFHHLDSRLLKVNLSKFTTYLTTPGISSECCCQRACARYFMNGTNEKVHFYNKIRPFQILHGPKAHMTQEGVDLMLCTLIKPHHPTQGSPRLCVFPANRRLQRMTRSRSTWSGTCTNDFNEEPKVRFLLHGAKYTIAGKPRGLSE